MNNVEILYQLEFFVNATDKKEINCMKFLNHPLSGKNASQRFIEQKLDYIHDNPCRGTWNLVKEPDGVCSQLSEVLWYWWARCL